MGVIWIDSGRFAVAAGGWTPAQISPALWLDASDSSTITSSSGLVSQWNDKSGNARHATQSTASRRPAYAATGFNGLPGITFDGVDDHLLHGLTSGGALTLIAVYKVNSSQSSYRGVMAIGPIDGSGSMLLARGTGSFISSYGSNDIVSTAAYASGQSVIAILEDDNGSAAKSFWINGSQRGTFTDNPFGQDVAHIGGLSNAGNQQAAAITIAECIVLASVAATSTRQQIEGYLAWKWGLTANLPAGHPYKTTPP
jgi:hypothetical protein